MALTLYFLSATLVFLRCASAQTDFSVTTPGISNWNQSEWLLSTSLYLPGQYQSRLSLANGYVGASLAAAGPFFELDVNQTDAKGQVTNGWPLFSPRLSFSTISGFYDIQPNGTGTNYPWLNQYGYESFISGIPHPTGIIFAFGDNYLDATASNTTISNFGSSISFKTGVANWNYTWNPPNSTAYFNVSFTTLFSRERPNVIAVQAVITASRDISGNVTDLLDGRSAMRSYLQVKGLDVNSTSIYSAIHPNGVANATAYVVSTADFKSYTNISSRGVAQGKYVSSNESTIGQTFNMNLKADQPATFFKYVGVASTDKFPDAQSVARQASADAQVAGWTALYSEHSKAWQALMTEETVDDFRDPVTGSLPSDESVQILHIASVANTFYLLQNLQPDGSDLNDNSIAVGGLASESYAGLIFWDADYWMAPGLNLAFPGYSKQISNFRIKQHPQALANAAFNGYPNGSSLYSWTAGRYGNCTGTGPCVDYEYHLNYDIAFNLFQQLNITQNYTWFNDGARQIIESTAMMTGQLLGYNMTTKSYWLHNATDPDEYANNVDNPAFTIASAAELLTLANNLRIQQGQSINQTWDSQAKEIAFPVAPSNITLEYETMNNSIQVKQADVVLLTYPLDYSLSNYTTAEKLLDLDYYSNRQSPNGPAMTYSVFAVDANALSPSGCAAYTYALNGFLPYLRSPWYQFSEQAVDDPNKNGNTNPAFPFLTGHGGANQAVPFGFLGLRTDQEVLYINPSLPPQISQVKIRNFYYSGAGISAFMNQTHTTMTRFSTNNVTAVTDKYANQTLPFTVGTPGSPSSETTTYHLATNSTITVPNRRYFTNLTHANNLLQCLPVTSEDTYAPGQFPLAATDGATATRWQPAKNSTASLLVNTTSVPFTRIVGAFFDWGTRPPRNATLYIGNATIVDARGNVELWGVEWRIPIDGIVLSRPYDAVAANSSTARSTEGVVPVAGNTTTARLGNEVWSGHYVRLEVEGCWEGDGAGATVGEFVLIGE